MRGLINGQEGGSLSLFKGGDATFNVMVLNDDGSIPANLSSDTLTLEIYADSQRSQAAVKSLALTVSVAAAGLYTCSPTAAGMDFGPGSYFGFVKRVQDEAGTPVSWGAKYTTIAIQ